MSFEGTIPPGEFVPTADQRILLQTTWEGYEQLMEIRGEKSNPRISYLDGTVELMSPSKNHEGIKSYLGMLIETFALERDVELSPYGSWTLKRRLKKAGVEPDECYLVGLDQTRKVPDLVIEVVWTSGGLNKLEIYRRLGVREVWYWKKDAVQIFILRGEDYVRTDVTEALPGLDLPLLCTFLDAPTATQAVKGYRAALAVQTGK